MKTKQKSGFAIVATMLVLMVIMAVMLIGVVGGTNAARTDSGGVTTAANNNLGAVRTRMRILGAINLADSGTELAMQWLRQQPSPPVDTSAFAPAGMWDTTVSGNWSTLAFSGGTIKVRLYPFASNNSPALKSYIIESIGDYQGMRQIIRSVAVQDTFAKYAFFTDNASDNWWVAGNTKFNGPVHINASNGKSINILWKSTGGTGNRLFTYNGADAFSTSATAINWNKDSISPPSTQVAPSTSGDWNRVAAGGAVSVRTSIASVPLPTASTVQKVAALGPTTSAPIASALPGVTIPNSGGASNGGVFIHGDVDNMILRASGGANSGSWWTKQTIEVYQSDTASNLEVKTTVVSDPTNGTTSLQRQTRTLGTTGSWSTGTTTNYTGNPNGVVYSDGNIGKQGGSGVQKSGGISGTVADSWMSTPPSGDTLYKNKWNIVTDASKNMNINGSITYAPGTGQPNSPILGLVSKTVQVVDKTSGGSDITSITVNASVVAYDTFDVTNPTTRTKGSFTLTGGYIATNAGQFGTFDANTGSLVNGFSRTLNYDRTMSETPPPYFPSTANQYIVQSSQRVKSTLQP